MDSLGVGLCPPTQDLSGSPMGSTLSPDQEGELAAKAPTLETLPCALKVTSPTLPPTILRLRHNYRGQTIFFPFHTLALSPQSKPRGRTGQNICSKLG